MELKKIYLYKEQRFTKCWMDTKCLNCNCYTSNTVFYEKENIN